MSADKLFILNGQVWPTLHYVSQQSVLVRLDQKQLAKTSELVEVLEKTSGIILKHIIEML